LNDTITFPLKHTISFSLKHTSLYNPSRYIISPPQIAIAQIRERIDFLLEIEAASLEAYEARLYTLIHYKRNVAIVEFRFRFSEIRIRII
jgi:hypothetical protein